MQFFETITINFITNILFAKDLYIKEINNTILILINKLIKHAIYIATIKELTLIQKILQNFYRKSLYTIIK